MSVRIRRDGSILCAAMHPEMEGDTYLHDGLHYRLSVELKVLVTEPHERHKQHGRWWWRNEVPAGVLIDPFYWPKPTAEQAERAEQIAREQGWLTDEGWIWESGEA